jgi:hypothetical protein
VRETSCYNLPRDCGRVPACTNQATGWRNCRKRAGDWGRRSRNHGSRIGISAGRSGNRPALPRQTSSRIDRERVASHRAPSLSRQRRLLDACGARGPREPVRTPVLIHDDPAGRIEPAPVVQETVKHLIAVRYGRPADPERIADAGLPLFCCFSDGA